MQNETVLYILKILIRYLSYNVCIALKEYLQLHSYNLAYFILCYSYNHGSWIAGTFGNCTAPEFSNHPVYYLFKNV